jgi:hypothetical protein
MHAGRTADLSSPFHMQVLYMLFLDLHFRAGLGPGSRMSRTLKEIWDKEW